MAALPGTLNVKLNPTGLTAVAGAVYAAVVMIYNARFHHGVISTPVIIAAAAAVFALLTRQVVTPTAAPRDGAGNQLVPVPAVPVRYPQPGGNVHLLDPGTGQVTQAVPHSYGAAPGGLPEAVTEILAAREPETRVMPDATGLTSS
jgi:hypothetical protein